jgi:hypothetical protein
VMTAQSTSILCQSVVDVASIWLLSTSLCRNDKEAGHLCVDNPVSRTRRRRGRILVVVYIARVQSAMSTVWGARRLTINRS